MKKLSPDELLIGAHTSIAGGVHHALLHGREIGATTIQIFSSNQRQWKSKMIDEEEVERFKKTLEETHIQKIMSHASYLVNLGSPQPEMLKKSRENFGLEIERCLQLGLSFLNFHPGASLQATKEECLDTIVESLLTYEDFFVDDSLRLLLETTAGQGSAVGWRFEELAYILSRVEKKIPLGVCIDTCHIFVAGYDVRTPAAWQETLKEFDRVVGLNKLYAFHLNDSMKGLGSKRDRHANLGEGEIGIGCFQFLMTDPRTREIPKYLETPGGMEIWDKEIGKLRLFAKGG
jgi:deoxyribonuclease-4